MNPHFGVGLALILVAAFHLVPAFTKGQIPKTMGKPLSKAEHPTEFLITTCVFSAAALAGAMLIIADLLV